MLDQITDVGRDLKRGGYNYAMVSAGDDASAQVVRRALRAI